MSNSDDPFRPAESVLRPRPGGGRRIPAPSSPPAADIRVEPLSADAAALLGVGLGPLVQAAVPVLLLAGGLRGTVSGPDEHVLRARVVDDLRQFEVRARDAGVASQVVLAGRYVLCAVVDEAVLSTPWGTQGGWSQRTLLVELHKESWGGEKFFELLTRMSADPERHIDLLELQYHCLAVGFAGKYQVMERGNAALAEVQRGLYRAIRDRREAPPAELSPHWRGIEDRRNPLIRYVPWWVVGAAALAVILLTYVPYRLWLSGLAEPVQNEMSRLAVVKAYSGPPLPTAGPTLRSLLREDEERGTLRVTSEGGEEVITVVGDDLFESGRAEVNRRLEPTLARIARALAQVRGRTVVVGHTDDQRLRSARFADNSDLSRARARSVADQLEREPALAGHIVVTGAGSSQPLFEPPSLPENRRRNRRVEIRHQAGV